MSSITDRALSIKDLIHAANLCNAAYEMEKLRMISPPGTSREDANARRVILTAAQQAIEAERDKILDSFAWRWARYRSIQLPEAP